LSLKDLKFLKIRENHRATSLKSSDFRAGFSQKQSVEGHSWPCALFGPPFTAGELKTSTERDWNDIEVTSKPDE
jgi:hypothetical protein